MISLRYGNLACLTAVMMMILVVSLSYAEGFAVSGRIGTLGLGVDLIKSLTEDFNARLGVNYLSYSYDGTESDVEYDFDLDLFSVAALLDWHPGQGDFRISGGLILNGNELTGNGAPTEATEIGNVEYAPAEVGTLTGKIDFHDLVPYFGIGWSNALGEDKRFGFVFDLGVIFQGSPGVHLSSNGSLASDPTFQANLTQEEKDFQDDIEVFKYYPVISFGISYKL